MTDVKQPPRRSRTKATAPSGTAVPHFTPAERAARGKAARRELPRSAHANCEPLGHRPDPVAAGASSKELRQFQANAAKARTRDSVRALNKLCQTVDGEPRIVGRPPVVTPIEDVLPGAEQQHLEDVIRRMIGSYRHTLPRPASAARGIPLCARRPQGRRRR